MRVGIPCMKCSLNPSQQTNKNTGKRAKTCSVNAAWKEMNDERIGRDSTIDKSMTNLNVWMCGNADDDVVKIVEKEINRINEIRREAGKRALRSDCVSVVSIVEKPNMDYMKNLSYEERKQFLHKSHEVTATLIEKWNPNWKIIEAVQHHDEFGGLSAHNHSLVLMSTVDENGIANMNAKKEMNLKFFNYINKNYPSMMREYGYEVEDIRTYDQLSEEEKIERRLNPKEHGIDAYIYKKQKEMELEKSIAEKEMKKVELDNQLENTVKEITNAPNLKSYQKVSEENETLKIEVESKNKLIQSLQEELKKLNQKLIELKQTIQKISHAIGSKMLKIIGVKNDDVQRELPQKEILDQFNEIQTNRLNRDPQNYRIIPDKENTGKFSILYRNDNGTYEVIENNLDSRFEADLKIKEIISLALNITGKEIERD